MPNWCYNSLSVSHKDPAMIERFIKAVNDERLFNEFVPLPEELQHTTAPSPTNEELVAKYGHSDWYSWSVDNWGTKWEITNSHVSETLGTSTVVSFDTAWSPPIPFYDKLVEQGFEVDATYTEEGMGFAGHYVDGEDNSVDLDFDENSMDWIAKIEDSELKDIVEEEYNRWLEYQEEEESEGD